MLLATMPQGPTQRATVSGFEVSLHCPPTAKRFWQFIQLFCLGANYRPLWRYTSFNLHACE
eukprot:4929365-Lingulodinium_polyedra.AAC.1